MLSQAQIEEYHERGYVVPDFRVSEDVLASIRERHSALVKANPEFHDYCPALLDHDRGFLDYCRDPDILDMIEQLIGPDIALWNTSFFAKPARNGKRTPWHQDGEYWPIRPLATCSVWLAVDASTTENGCLRVIPGSHRKQALAAHNSVAPGDVTLTQELDAGEFDADAGEDIVLEAGQLSLHDVYLFHGSEANTSDKPRRGMTMRFMPTTSLYDRALAAEKFKGITTVDHSKRPVFLMRGADRHGGNEFANA